MIRYCGESFFRPRETNVNVTVRRANTTVATIAPMRRWVQKRTNDHAAPAPVRMATRRKHRAEMVIPLGTFIVLLRLDMQDQRDRRAGVTDRNCSPRRMDGVSGCWKNCAFNRCSIAIRCPRVCLGCRSRTNSNTGRKGRPLLSGVRMTRLVCLCAVRSPNIVARCREACVRTIRRAGVVRPR